MDDLLVASAAALAFVFGWNNSSFIIGNVRGSGSLSFRSAVVLSVSGLLLGALVEGSKMQGAFVGSLANTVTSSALFATLVASVVLVLALTLLDLPVSFSMVVVGAFLGASASASIAVNAGRVGEIVAFWFVAPVASAFVAYLIYSVSLAFVPRLGLLAIDSLNRTEAVVSALAVSYTLGANNIGMIYGAAGIGNAAPSRQIELMLLIGLVAIAGVVTLGRGALGGTIGDKMLTLSPQGVFASFAASSITVWLGTQLAIPLSISQCLLGGMLGAAFAKSFSVLNGRLVRESVSVWLVAPLVAFGLAYGIAIVL